VTPHWNGAINVAYLEKYNKISENIKKSIAQDQSLIPFEVKLLPF